MINAAGKSEAGPKQTNPSLYQAADSGSASNPGQGKSHVCAQVINGGPHPNKLRDEGNAAQIPL